MSRVGMRSFWMYLVYPPSAFGLAGSDLSSHFLPSRFAILFRDRQLWPFAQLQSIYNIIPKEVLQYTERSLGHL
jgi:hypothetical protein